MCFSIIRIYNILVILLSALLCSACAKAPSFGESNGAPTDEEVQQQTMCVLETEAETEVINRLDLSVSDPNLHRLYADEKEGFLICGQETITGSEGWYNGEPFEVYVTDADMNIVYEKSLRRDMFEHGLVEYYVIDNGIYEICTDGTEDHLIFRWSCVMGQGTALKEQGEIDVSCSPQQDFAGIARKLELLGEQKARGVCVLRLGKQIYDVGDVTQEYDAISPAFEWLNLGYYLPVQGDIGACVEELRDYLTGKILPSDYGDTGGWISNMEQQAFTDWLWIALNLDEDMLYTDNGNGFYEAVREGFERLLGGQQEAFQIFAVDGSYICEGAYSADQNAVLTCSLKERSDFTGQCQYKIARSDGFEADQIMPQMIASLVCSALLNMEEGVYFCLTEEESDIESLISGMMVYFETDELGYRYMTYFGLGALNPPGGFVTLGDIKSGKAILEDEGQRLWSYILDTQKPDRILEISRSS